MKIFYRYGKSCPSRKGIKTFMNSIPSVGYASVSNSCLCKITNNKIELEFKITIQYINMSLKRLKKEIENYDEKKYYLKYTYPISKFLDNFTLFYDYEINNNVPFSNAKTKIIVKNKDNNYNNIFISIPTDYPFKPPSVDWFPMLSTGINFYQNTSYHRFMNSLNSNKILILKYLLSSITANLILNLNFKSK